MVDKAFNKNNKDKALKMYQYPITHNDSYYLYNNSLECRIISKKMSDTKTMNFHCNRGIFKGKTYHKNIKKFTQEGNSEFESINCQTERLNKKNLILKSLSIEKYKEQKKSNMISFKCKNQLKSKKYMVLSQDKLRFMIASPEEAMNKEMFSPKYFLPKLLVKNHNSKETFETENNSTNLNTLSQDIPIFNKKPVDKKRQNELSEPNPRYNVKNRNYGGKKMTCQDLRLYLSLHSASSDKELNFLLKKLKNN